MCAGLIMLICRQGHILAAYHFPKYQCATLLCFLCHFWWNVNKLYISYLCTFSITIVSVLWFHLLPEITNLLYIHIYSYIHTHIHEEREEEHLLVTRIAILRNLNINLPSNSSYLLAMPLEWLSSPGLSMSNSAPQNVSLISWVCESAVGFCSLHGTESFVKNQAKTGIINSLWLWISLPGSGWPWGLAIHWQIMNDDKFFIQGVSIWGQKW